MPQQKENDKTVIQYESENGEIKELIFSLDINISENRFNNDAALDFVWLNQSINMMNNYDN